MQAKKGISSHLSTLADFAIEMFDVLDEINYQSYNDFVLRVGMWPRTPARCSCPTQGLVAWPLLSRREGRPPRGSLGAQGQLPLKGSWDPDLRPKGLLLSSRNT